MPRGLSRKFAHQVMNGNDVLNFVGIGAAEDKCVIHISFDSPDECHGDAIWRCAGIAGLKAVEAVSYVFTLFADPFYKGVEKRPSRHMDRALDDCHIFLFCLDVHLFKFVRRIAFFRGYETCCHLHAGKTERKIMSDIFFIKNTAAEYDGDFFIVLFFKLVNYRENFQNFFFIAVVFMKFYFFTGVAQMAARFRTFDDNQICCRVVVPVP